MTLGTGTRVMESTVIIDVKVRGVIWSFPLVAIPAHVD